jgi:hypothetical protein
MIFPQHASQIVGTLFLILPARRPIRSVIRRRPVTDFPQRTFEITIAVLMDNEVAARFTSRVVRPLPVQIHARVLRPLARPKKSLVNQLAEFDHGIFSAVRRT